LVFALKKRIFAQHLNKNLATSHFGGCARQSWPNQEAFVSIALLNVWKNANFNAYVLFHAVR